MAWIFIFFNTFIADVVGEANTLNTGDRLYGNDGDNELLAEVIGNGQKVEEAIEDYDYGDLGAGQNISYIPGAAIRPQTENIQEVEFTALLDYYSSEFDTPVFIDAARMKDLESVGSVGSNADLVVTDLTTQQSDGDPRATSTMTIRMDHTGNADSMWSESNYHAYFDQNYLIYEEEPGIDKIFYQFMNMDAVFQGFDPLAGVVVDQFKFEFDGTEYDLSEEIGDYDDPDGSDIMTHANLIPHIEDALEAKGLEDDITVELGDPFTVQHPDEGVPVTAENIVISAPGGEDLAANEDWVRINPAQESLFIDGVEVRRSARLERADDEPGVPEEDLNIPVELYKVGRGSDGGELVIGGMSKQGDNTWDGGSGSRGIPVFDVSVEGNAEKSSSLSGMRSTNNTLREVNITTDETTYDADEEDPANLDIGNSNTGNVSAGDGIPLKDVKTIDATDFLGDLQIGTADNPARITTEIIGKYDWDLANFDYDLGRGDNTLWLNASDLTTNGALAAFQMDIDNYGGDDLINVVLDPEATAHSSFDLEINTRGGDDTIQVSHDVDPDDLDSQFLNHSDLMNITIDAGSGNNVVRTHDGDSGYGAADITTGNGNKELWDSPI